MLLKNLLYIAIRFTEPCRWKGRMYLYVTISKTETSMKHWDDTVFLDVLAPADGRRYVPRNPTGAVISFCATPGENDVTSSSFLRVPVVMLHLWGSISLKLQSQEEESSSGSYCVVWPWARCKTLVLTKWLDSHVKRFNIKYFQRS